MSILALALPLFMIQQTLKPVSLMDGKSLAGWQMDVPELDSKPEAPKPFLIRDGILVILGNPTGHLITEASYENYRLVTEYRFSKQAGNSGLVVHTSKLRLLNNFLPQGIEVQMRSGNAGDFHLFGETLKQQGASAESTARRLVNFTDDSEKPVGDWNTMIVECSYDTIKVWVNGTLVNHGIGSSVKKGKIAIQSEGSEVEIRKLELTHLSTK